MKYFSDDIQDDALKRYGRSYLLLGALELIVRKKMCKALDLRNRVAHYNFYKISIIDAEEANLRLIISAMGEELVETETGIES